MPHAPELSRVGLRIGERTLDVAIPTGLPLYDVLRSAGLDPAAPGLSVVDSTGVPLDLHTTTGARIADGAVLHVLTRTRAAAPARSRWAGVADPAAQRPTTSPWWLGVAGCAAVVLMVTIGFDVLAGGPGAADPTARWVLAGVLLTAAVALAGAGVRPGVFGSAWPTVVAALLAVAGGMAGVDPALAARGHLMIVTGLVAATSVTAVRWAVSRRLRDPAQDLAGVLVVVLGIAATGFAGALLAGVPSVVPAAVLLGALPLSLRVLPSLCVDVPDEQLIDVAHVGRTLGSVRGGRPQPLGPVNERQVRRTVAGAERRRDAGTVVLSLMGPVVAPAVLLSAGAGLTGWAAPVAAVLVALALALAPRTARGTLVRYVPRLCAALLLLEVVAFSGTVPGAAGPVAALGVGLLIAAVSLPIGRGWRSVGFSRLADILETLAAVVALPAALAAAGAIEILRQATSS